MLPLENQPSPRAALIAGVAVLVMALTVPVAEFYIFPQLIDYGSNARTAQNISENRTMFSLAIFIHFLTVVCDIVAGWALYLFLRPANRDLALLSAWFRMMNAVFTMAALANLVQVLALVKSPGFPGSAEASALNGEIMFHIRSFNLQWRFMLVFFGLYMILLGFVVWQAKYVPRIMCILLFATGAGYVIDNLKYFLYPEVDTGFLWFTYFGELIFMFWLLFKGSRLPGVPAAADLGRGEGRVI